MYGGAERMRIDSSGNVGIGTASPQNKVDIVGNMLSRENTAAGATPILLRNSNSGNNTTKSSSALFQGADTVGTVKNIGSIGFFPDDADYIGSNLRFLVRSGDTTPTERARIDSGGNLLVGTTAAEAFGRVCALSTTAAYPCYAARNTGGAGSFFHYFINDNNTAIIGSISNSGNIATLYNTTSDARLKENIADAENASNLIDALQVRKFDWKIDGSHQRYGFVAQELLEVAPEAVSQPTSPEEMMGVDYSKLVPMLVKELQSLRARVAELEGK
jgi:hypothetical protein